MNKTTLIIIFIYLVLIEIIVDDSFEMIDTYIGKTLNILHHVFAVFLFFPFIIVMPRLHLIIVLFTCISWIVTKGCVFTELTNIFYKNNKPVKFQNFRYHLYKYFNKNVNKNKKNTDNIILFLLGSVLLFDIYNINKGIPY
jgi:hypothetical protein